MNTFLSGLMATTLAASFALASALPLNATPMFVPSSPEVRTDVEQVNHTRRHWRYLQERRAERRAYRQWKRNNWRSYDDGYYSARRHYRPYRPYYQPWRDDGVTLEFNF